MSLYNEIAKVAYELYEKGGRHSGRDLEYWLEAERIVRARQENVKAEKEAVKPARKRAATAPGEKKPTAKKTTTTKRATGQKKAKE